MIQPQIIFKHALNMPVLIISIGLLIYGAVKVTRLKENERPIQKGIVYVIIGGTWTLLTLWPFLSAELTRLLDERQSTFIYYLTQCQECLFILLGALGLIIYGLAKTSRLKENEKPMANGIAYVVIGVICIFMGGWLLWARITSGLSIHDFYNQYFSWFFDLMPIL